MSKLIIVCLTVLFCKVIYAQNNTDISLKWKDSKMYEHSIESLTGNLYDKVAHHGPAIENEWLAFRLYFDFKVSIDVYNKTKQGLELATAEWYPTADQQKKGFGADYYKVGTTMGCGGIQLWDGTKAMFLDPVKKRTARVCKEANYSYMEMLSEGISYKGDSIDVLVRVTVFSGIRAAKVEAFALCSKPVQFLTGINYHPSTKTTEGRNFISTWGLHPEDVAAFTMNIGAAIIYNPCDFISNKKAQIEFNLISKPTKYLSTWITSCCEQEKEMNSIEKFNKYLENFNK